MRSAVELKQIFQKGWNDPARIQNYVRLSSEFTEGESHLAWREALGNALETSNRLKILDVGTGPGIFACLYSQMGRDCVGLDFSESMLEVARRRATEMKLDCTFVFGDAEEPPLAEASFDVISSRHLLFNLPRPGVAIRQWVRLLKPGGRMILIGNEHDGDGGISSFAARARQWLRRGPGRWLRKDKPRWQPAPGYVDAAKECPLFRNDSKMLRVVMEAAGLQEIHTVNTDAIRNAWIKKGNGSGPSGLLRPKFFILIGKKP